MKILIVFSAFLCLLSCSNDDTYDVVQVGKWSVTQVAEYFLDSQLHSSYTFHFDLQLKNDKTGSLNNYELVEVRNIVDWNVENDTIKLVVEVKVASGEIVKSNWNRRVASSQEETQEWYYEYIIKPEGTVWYDVKDTWYLTRIE